MKTLGIFIPNGRSSVAIGSQPGRISAATLSAATGRPVGCFPAAAAGVLAALGSRAMIGFFAAFVAIYLGTAGPTFCWRGASLLGLAAVAIGAIDTALAAREANSHGLHFAVTPGSITVGLALQSCFMLTFYALAPLARWSALQLASDRIVKSQARDEG